MVQVAPEVQALLRNRQYLESQGQLARKEFMLHDQNNWPTVSIPGGGIPTNPYVQPGTMYPGMGRGGTYGYNQSHPANVVGQPPNKRQRVSAPLARPGVPAPGMDTSIEDEENTTIGDQLDHLTPQEISQVRYMQHHEWMEEIFSSPFAPSQIVPVDLGLGLAGELSTLTAGLAEAPIEDAKSPPKGPIGGHEDKVAIENSEWKKGTADNAKLRSLRKEDVDELEARVHTHAEHARREMEDMRKEHAKRMSDMLRRSKTLATAERRLRDAKGNESVGSGVELWRVDVQPWSVGSKETVTDVVREVEAKLGTRVQGRKDIVCIDKGGYTEAQANGTQVQNDAQNDMSNNVAGELPNNNGQDSFGGFDGTGLEDTMDGSMDLHNTAAGLLDDLGEDSFHSTPRMGMTQSAAPTQNQDPSEIANDQQHTHLQEQAQQGEELGETDDGMDLVESMDLDEQLVDIEAGDAAADEQEPSRTDANHADDWVMVEQQQQESEGDNAITTQLQMEPDQKAHATSQASAHPSNEQEEGAMQPEEHHDVPQSMFDDAAGGATSDHDFSALEDFNSAGDGLVDFNGGAGGDGDGLDLGLDDSAFGNAVFGTEDRTEGAEDEVDGLGGSAA